MDPALSTPNSSSDSLNALKQQVTDTRVLSTETLVRPHELAQKMPASEAAYRTVLEGRQAVRKILHGDDSRLLVVCGPCSIHDLKGAFEYAQHFAALRERVSDRLELVMRVYFEKPRTTVGWKGLINDPDLDDSFNMDKGLTMARELLIQINELGVPTATEMLEPLTPQYIGDLVTWGAIGARTTESQTHRQMASGLSVPVGFKNSTDGNLQIALDAMRSAQSPHTFLGINEQGEIAVVATKGNDDTHLILRGGSNGTNYEVDAVTEAASQLKNVGLEPLLMVDCSHANSSKKHDRQPLVFRDLIQQIVKGRKVDTPASAIIGCMLESNLHEGNQKIPADLSELKYGVSVTDACLNWADTEALLLEGYDALG